MTYTNTKFHCLIESMYGCDACVSVPNFRLPLSDVRRVDVYFDLILSTWSAWNSDHWYGPMCTSITRADGECRAKRRADFRCRIISIAIGICTRISQIGPYGHVSVSVCLSSTILWLLSISNSIESFALCNRIAPQTRLCVLRWITSKINNMIDKIIKLCICRMFRSHFRLHTHTHTHNLCGCMEEKLKYPARFHRLPLGKYRADIV